MTQIHEPGFRVDLPETWLRTPTEQPGSVVYGDPAGTATLTVMLLAVRPAYSIADRSRLHSDYMDHRAKFERGQRPSLEQSPPVTGDVQGVVEGSWGALDLDSGRRQLHRVLLRDNILAHFCYEDFAVDESGFVEHASSVLSSAAIEVPVGPGGGSV